MICVIVPLYMDEEEIGNFIENLKRQTKIPHTVFAVRPSEDKTLDIVKMYCGIHDEFDIVMVDKPGTGTAINEAFKLCAEDYVMIANCDFRFGDRKTFEDIEQFLSKKIGVLKISRPVKPLPELTVLQNCLRMWDVRNLNRITFTIVQRRLFPKYPDISYGEDRVASSIIRNKNPLIVTVERDYGFERGDYLKFGLGDFIRRYRWYGKTKKKYTEEIKALNLKNNDYEPYVAFEIVKPALAFIAFITMKISERI